MLAISDLRPVVASSYRLPSPFVVPGFSGRPPAVARLIGTCALEGRCPTPLFALSYASLLGAALVTSWLEASDCGERPSQDERSIAAFSRASASHHGVAPQAWRAATLPSPAGKAQ